MTVEFKCLPFSCPGKECYFLYIETPDNNGVMQSALGTGCITQQELAVVQALITIAQSQGIRVTFIVFPAWQLLAGVGIVAAGGLIALTMLR